MKGVHGFERVRRRRDRETGFGLAHINTRPRTERGGDVRSICPPWRGVNGASGDYHSPPMPTETVTVRAFDPADLDGAAALLADRHRRHRQAEPLLDAAYEVASGA